MIGDLPVSQTKREKKKKLFKMEELKIVFGINKLKLKMDETSIFNFRSFLPIK